MVAFCSSPRFVEHETGPHHPERADRVRAIHRAVRAAGMVGSAEPFPGFRIDLGAVANPRGVKLVEVEPFVADEEWLSAVHTPEHVERVRAVCRAGGGALDGDTTVSHESFDVAKLSVGAVLAACDAVVSGRARRAFAAGRPPGHHAEPDRAMGFCLFGNVACAARYLQRRHAVGKIAIVDFDVHHGNGTQACFEADPSVLFVSLHQHPRTCYPGTGYGWEEGTGAGKGFTLNVPMEPGWGDEEYVAAMRGEVLPKLDEFRPEFLLVSAGFDAHREDPLADMNVSEEGFERITDLLVEASNVHTQGRIVSALEGGYDLRALARSAVRHLTALAR